MQARHNPTIDRRYWFGITCASIFGTNLGDLYAHESGLSIGVGVLVLAILFAATCWIETIDRTAHDGYYWLAIIIIRTGATNIADYLAFRVRVPAGWLATLLAVTLAVLAWRGAARRAPGSVGLAGSTSAQTNLYYWAAMLTAGVFGTAVGDDISRQFGQGISSITLAVALAILLATTQSREASRVAIYWCAVALARTAGTCMGDWLAENRILHIGLPISTLLSGALFAAVLVFWRGAFRDPRATA